MSRMLLLSVRSCWQQVDMHPSSDAVPAYCYCHTFLNHEPYDDCDDNDENVSNGDCVAVSAGK
jgi:hypothetical protein